MHRLKCLKTLALEPNPLYFLPDHVWKGGTAAAKRGNDQVIIQRILNYLKTAGKAP
jgi:hypothetical protein